MSFQRDRGMATGGPDSDASGTESGEVFASYARLIDSAVDPRQEAEKRHIRVLNSFAQILGQDELIPVGSSVDGSKVNVPGDCGDIDILLLSRSVVLDQALFEYDKRYPAFLRVRVTGKHEQYFRNIELIDGEHLPVSALKALKARFYSLVKFFINGCLRPGVNGKDTAFNFTRHSAVGLENLQLDTESLTSLNLPKSKGVTFHSFCKLVCHPLNTFMDMVENSVETEEFSEENENMMHAERNDFSTTLCRLIDLIKDDGDDESDRDRDNQSNTQESELKQSSSRASSIDKIDAHLLNAFGHRIVDQHSIENQDATSTTTSNIEASLIGKGYADTTVDTPGSTTQPSCDAAGDIKTKYDKTTSTTQMNEDDSKNETTKKQYTKVNKLLTADYVPAFALEGWPHVADEWLTRNRMWPLQDTIDNIRRTGCHIVAKRPLLPEMNGDPKNEDHSPEHDMRDPYFRVSFSMCEVVLSKSLSESQLQCWRILKAFQKAYLKTEPRVLASYHWKNVAFWVFEETEPDFWKEETVLEGVCKALDFMIIFLRLKFVPLYFVRTCNLIDGCREDLINEVCDRVQQIRRHPVSYLKHFIDFPPNAEQVSVEENVLRESVSEENAKSHREQSVYGMSQLLRQMAYVRNKEDEPKTKFHTGFQTILKTMDEVIREVHGENEKILMFVNALRDLTNNVFDDNSDDDDGFDKVFDTVSDATTGLVNNDHKPQLQNFFGEFKRLVKDDESSDDSKRVTNFFSSFAKLVGDISSKPKKRKKEERAFPDILKTSFGNNNNSGTDKKRKDKTEIEFDLD